MSFGQSGFLPNGNEAAPVVKVNLSDAGVLTVIGTAKRDEILIREGNSGFNKIIEVRLAGQRIFAGRENKVKSIVVNALGGNDLITNSTAKKSILRGGTGNDVIKGGRGQDELRGQAGKDTISDVSGFNRIFGDAGNDVLLGGDKVDQIRGGAGNDLIKGRNGNDKLYGEAGNDTLGGQAGDDDLFGGPGNDTLKGGTGSDLLVGDSGQDKLYGEAGDDILDGLSGNDLLYGADGDDYLKGGVGNDVLEGGSGNDEGYGGDHADSIYAGSGNDIFFGEAGNDLLKGGEGNDRLEGGTGNDKMYGEAGADLLIGGNDNDYLIGSTGADDLRGSAGNDVLDADSPLFKDTSIDKLFGETGVDTLYGSFSLDVLTAGGSVGDRERTRFFVETTSDEDDGDASTGNLSFREAVGLAGDDDIISFAMLTAASAKTISVVNGTYGLLNDVTIQGIGSADRLTFNGAGNANQRFMTIFDGSNVVIENVTIREFNAGGGNGGAIFLDNGNLTLRNIVGRQNTATDGGFLYLDGNDTTARVDWSNILENTASNIGGGLYNNDGSLVVDRTTLDGNTSASQGGGVFTNGATSQTRIISSTLSNNKSTGSYGGGIRHNDGALSIINSTLSGNQSASFGSAIDASISATSTVTITNSTIVFNTGGSGGFTLTEIRLR
jgi:Ca2+-binding RTX toxin-like protein